MKINKITHSFKIYLRCEGVDEDDGSSKLASLGWLVHNHYLHLSHHNLHHEITHEHLLVPHHDHPPLLHPPSLVTAAPLGACTPLCSVLDLIVFNPEFTTLVSLIRAAGLVELLSQPGPITLFAPTNAAFDKISPLTFKV